QFEAAEHAFRRPRGEDLGALGGQLARAFGGQRLLLALLPVHLAAGLLVLAARRRAGGPAAAVPFAALAVLPSPLCNVAALVALAGYWAARRLSFLTRSRTPVLPLDGLGGPFPHGGNADGFLDGRLALPEYRFVAVTPSAPGAPHPAVVAAQFGEPARKVPVG